VADAPLAFVAYDDLGDRPNVVVDGSPTPSSVLCLSHWPGIVSPPEFAADLSAQMAFLYLEAFDRHGVARAASNNHFDQDGLVSLFALTDPDAARARRALLVEVARAGDFGTTSNPDAARISMVLSAYATPGQSPLGDLAADYATMTADLYGELLGRLPELCDHPERFAALVETEEAHLRASEEALSSGTVTITESAELDLAVVRIPTTAPRGGGHRFAGTWVEGLHPMALCNATSCFTVATVDDGRYEVTHRYESWVQYRSRRPRPRVAWGPLADLLNAEERSAPWVADRVSALTPGLRLEGDGHSDLTPDRFLTLLEGHLRTAPPAWNPYPADS
jgi:hypothetical protein